MSDVRTTGPQASVIWNEGRVVGYSAYESYVKHHVSEFNPEDIPVASEKEWLAASLAMGASILLKISKNSRAEGEHYWLPFTLPANSWLGAANTIVASFFDGQAEQLEGYPFAKKVTSFGTLISNTDSLHPEGIVNDINGQPGIPTFKNLNGWDETKRKQLDSYLRIIDGVVLQPGTWSEPSEKPPARQLSPDLTKSPSIRLHCVGPIQEDFWVLLSGFTMRAILAGSAGLDTTTTTPDPQNGDFLGPQCFPWASKIVFCVPNSAVEYLVRTQYARKIPMSDPSINVWSRPIIDLESSKIAEFYQSNFTNSKIPYHVDKYEFPQGDSAVFTVYRQSDEFPPALLASKVTTLGDNNLLPVDTIAPRTIKLFNAVDTEHLQEEAEKAKRFEKTTPNNYAFIRDMESGLIYHIDADGNLILISESELKVENIGTSQDPIYVLVNTFRGQTFKSLSMQDTNRNTFNTKGSTGTLTEKDPFSWQFMLNALYQNKKLDVLGKTLREFSNAMNATGDGDYIININRGNVAVNPLPPAPEFPDFAVSSIALNPLKSGRSSLIDTMQLDIFAYTQTTGSSGTKLTTINSIATLTCVQNTSYTQSGLYNEWKQVFEITQPDSIQAVKDIVTTLDKSDVKPQSQRALFFTSGGRPIFRSVPGSDSRWLGAPFDHVDVTLFINITNLWVPGTSRLVGVVFGRTNPSSPWIDAPSTTAYSGGVALTAEVGDYTGTYLVRKT